MVTYSFDVMKSRLMTHGVPGYAIKSDNLMTMFSHKPTLDLNVFDDYLHEKYGNYEEHDKSMEDILSEEFGEYADEVVNYFF